MADLTDFGGGVLPEKKEDTGAHDSRSNRARHRRKQYRLGRCRAISTSKGCRCGGPVIEDTEGDFCYYHGVSHEPVTIDSSPDLLARWCGTSRSPFEEIPEPCREALNEVDSDE